jgi:hypothetical protein
MKTFKGLIIPQGVHFLRFVTEDHLNNVSERDMIFFTSECSRHTNSDDFVDDDYHKGVSVSCKDDDGHHVDCWNCVYSCTNKKERLEYFKYLRGAK